LRFVLNFPLTCLPVLSTKYRYSKSTWKSAQVEGHGLVRVQIPEVFI
jgi:hypothetical protein